MTLFLAGVFLLIAAFTITLLRRNYRGALVSRFPRTIITGTQLESQWCRSCRRSYTFTGDPLEAWLAHCRDVCPTTKVQP